jgi:hypothetical protein
MLREVDETEGKTCFEKAVSTKTRRKPSSNEEFRVISFAKEP